MFNLRNIFAPALVLLAGIWSVTAQGKGPLITNKVYFDIKQGDENLGRSMSSALLYTTMPYAHVFCT